MNHKITDNTFKIINPYFVSHWGVYRDNSQFAVFFGNKMNVQIGWWSIESVASRNCYFKILRNFICKMLQIKCCDVREDSLGIAILKEVVFIVNSVGG